MLWSGAKFGPLEKGRKCPGMCQPFYPDSVPEIIFLKKSADDKSMKNYPACRVEFSLLALKSSVNLLHAV